MNWKYDWTICAGCGCVPKLHAVDEYEQRLCVRCVFPFLHVLRQWWFNVGQEVRARLRDAARALRGDK